MNFLRFYPWQILRHGDLGPSLSYQGWTVNEVLKKSLPVSIALGLFAIENRIWCLVRQSGTLAAIRQGGVLDYFSLAIRGLVGISIPSFVGAGLLLVVFSDTAALAAKRRVEFVPADDIAGGCFGDDSAGVYRAADAGFDAGYAGE